MNAVLVYIWKDAVALAFDSFVPATLRSSGSLAHLNWAASSVNLVNLSHLSCSVGSLERQLGSCSLCLMFDDLQSNLAPAN